jgi:DNA-binding NarL/FixJ family response regulator
MDIRIVIFDDNDDFRDSMFHLVNSAEGFECVGDFADCNKILRDIAETKPDVVLMDIEMPGISGIEGVFLIKEKYPDIKIVMQTIFEDDNKIFDSLCAGASGYILKNISTSRILESIKDVFDGGAPMTPSIAAKVLKMFRQMPGTEKIESFHLTDREKEILSCLVKGMSYKLVAASCCISPDTVNAHIRNIYKKLNVHSKSEAVVKAMKRNIL